MAEDVTALQHVAWFYKDATLEKVLQPNASVAVLVCCGENEGRPSINDHANGLPADQDSSSAVVVAACAVGAKGFGSMLLCIEQSLLPVTDPSERSRYSAWSHADSRYVTPAERQFVMGAIWPVLFMAIARRSSSIIVMRHMLGDAVELELDISESPGAFSLSIEGRDDDDDDGGMVRVPGAGHYSSAGIEGSKQRAAGPMLLLTRVASAMAPLVPAIAVGAGGSQAERLRRCGAAISSVLSVAAAASLRFTPQARGLFDMSVVDMAASGAANDAVGEAAMAAVAQHVSAMQSTALGAQGAADVASIIATAQKPAAPCSPVPLPDVAPGVPNSVEFVSSICEMVGKLAVAMGIDVPADASIEELSALISAVSGFARSSKSVSPAMQPEVQLQAWYIGQMKRAPGKREEIRYDAALYLAIGRRRAAPSSPLALESAYGGTAVRKLMTAPQALKARADDRKKAGGGDGLASNFARIEADVNARKLDPRCVEVTTYCLNVPPDARFGAGPVAHYFEAKLISVLLPFLLCLNTLVWTFASVLSSE